MPGRTNVTSAEVLHGVEVIERLRELHEREPLIIEVRHRPLEQVRTRDEIRIQHHHQLAIGPLQRRVQVPRLGVLIGRACQVPHAELLTHRPDLLAATVVEHPGLVLEPQLARGKRSLTQQPHTLVMRRDEHINRPARRRREHRISHRLLPAQAKPPLETARIPDQDNMQQECEQPIALGRIEQDRQPERMRVKRRDRPPRQVVHAHRDRDNARTPNQPWTTRHQP